jgi:serine/threonine-protein kinase
LNLRSDCALKFIHASQAHDAELRQRFLREARAAARLQSPHCVQVLDVDQWQGSLFIAMELLRGESLESLLVREGCLSPTLTLEILTQVARGLDEAHAARLVHRDLKPENIFLVEERRLLVKILDFGIAKQMDANAGMQTALGTLLGTPAYMSPEQADGGKAVDYRSDLWALAVVAFRCLTGSSLFDGGGLGQILIQLLQSPIPAPSSRNPRLSSAIDRWWFSVLQRDPALRPPSASALVAGLRQALASTPAASAAEAPPRVAPAKQAATAMRTRKALRVTTAKQLTLAPLSARGRALPARPRLFAGSVAFAVLGAIALFWALGRAVSAPGSVGSAASAARPPAPSAAPAASAALLPVTTSASPTPAAVTPVRTGTTSLQPSSPTTPSKASPAIKLVVSDPVGAPPAHPLPATPRVERQESPQRERTQRKPALAVSGARARTAETPRGVATRSAPVTPPQPAATDARLGF